MSHHASSSSSESRRVNITVGAHSDQSVKRNHSLSILILIEPTQQSCKQWESFPSINAV